jgi:hypothetical protein
VGRSKRVEISTRLVEGRRRTGRDSCGAYSAGDLGEVEAIRFSILWKLRHKVVLEAESIWQRETNCSAGVAVESNPHGVTQLHSAHSTGASGRNSGAGGNSVEGAALGRSERRVERRGVEVESGFSVGSFLANFLKEAVAQSNHDRHLGGFVPPLGQWSW